MTSTEKQPVRQRRGAFVGELEQLARDLASENEHRAQPARRKFAQLRRALIDQRYEHEPMALLFEFAPPREEEEVWLTIAGLFALNPHPGDERIRLGEALGRLNATRPGATGQKRLLQLLAADANSLPQHLRSALQLLASHNIAVDFRSLINDAVTLLLPHRESEEKRRKVRWQWARDFHRHNTSSTNNSDSHLENDQ